MSVMGAAAGMQIVAVGVVCAPTRGVDSTAMPPPKKSTERIPGAAKSAVLLLREFPHFRIP